ncbi:MAG: hypothetical protein L3J16_00470 [Anaerolineales bacterium]|nr:hypothetical protein [Anaerolineales bacterium]
MLKIGFKTEVWYTGVMVVFEDLTDVDEWLDPLDYIALWDAVAPYNIFSIADRDHCDGLIAGGKVPQATILKGLKHIAYDGLRDRFDLQHRRHETHISQGIKSVH